VALLWENISKLSYVGVTRDVPSGGAKQVGIGTLSDLIGIEIPEAKKGRSKSRLDLRDKLMALSGYLHAATLVALTDTSCDYGTFRPCPRVQRASPQSS
jgi:acyl-coenzyme A thioesterase PaaI-like protein